MSTFLRMKSLVLLEIQRRLLAGDNNGAKITAITIDPSTESLYVSTELNRADATTEVTIFCAKGEEVRFSDHLSRGVEWGAGADDSSC